MSKEVEMHDIIADFNNIKTTSSYSISSEEEASTSLSNSDKIQTTILMCNKKMMSFYFTIMRIAIVNAKKKIQLK